MRLKKNRAERNRELLDGIEQAPAAFARVVESAEGMAEAFRRTSQAARRCCLAAFCVQVNRTCKRTAQMTGLSLVYPELN
jgi:hypothetical protein